MPYAPKTGWVATNGMPGILGHQTQVEVEVKPLWVTAVRHNSTSCTPGGIHDADSGHASRSGRHAGWLKATTGLSPLPAPEKVVRSATPGTASNSVQNHRLWGVVATLYLYGTML